jgi:cell division protease FtsH
MKDLWEKMRTPYGRSVIAVLLLFGILLGWQTFFAVPPGPKTYHIDYSRFLDQVNAGNVESVSLQKLRVNGKFRKPVDLKPEGQQNAVSVSHFTTELPSFQGDGLIAKLAGKDVRISVKPPQETSPIVNLLLYLLPWALIIGVWVYFAKKASGGIGQAGPGGIFGFAQSRAKLYDVSRPPVTFEDVAGMVNEKQELQEIVDFLRHPEKFRKIGAKVPKGVLLVGPPGTGKTLLARAVAGEANVPFYSISASEFIEMFVGVGASRVRDMFRKAKAAQPSIIFVDEIDAVGRRRGTGLGGGHDEREQTLNQLLGEMDGFDPHEQVILIAATNRPDVLDPALLRPGRFDRQIVIDRPAWKERMAILAIHLRDKQVADGIDLEGIARSTPGMTGADLENLANEAALIAVRRGKERIDMDDFDAAKDRIVMGTVRDDPVSGREKRITAYHEAGHALVAWETPGMDPIYKVSIIPRGRALGVTQMVPAEDRHFYPRKYLVQRLTVLLGGRGAEKIVFDDVSTGAQNDLKQATSLAEKMVAQWGMSDKVGPLSLGRGEEHPFLGRELAQPKQYSEEMAWVMDQEIRGIVVDAEDRAQRILAQNRAALDRLADALLEEESLEKEELERILGPQDRAGQPS